MRVLFYACTVVLAGLLCSVCFIPQILAVDGDPAAGILETEYLFSDTGGTVEVLVMNTGGGVLEWEPRIHDGETWLSIMAIQEIYGMYGGGTFELVCAANETYEARTGYIAIEPFDAGEAEIEVTQLGLPGAHSGEPATIEGRVANTRTRTMLGGVLVEIFDSTTKALVASTESYENGEYFINAPNSETELKLRFSKDGFDDKELEYIFAPAQVNAALQPSKPRPPENLVANGGRNAVFLRWKANIEPDMDGYNVYRDGIRLNDELIDTSRYADTGAGELQYRQMGAGPNSYHEVVPGSAASLTHPYYVTAVDLDGNESRKAGPVVASPANIRVWVNHTEVTLTESGNEETWVRVPIYVNNAAGYVTLGIDVDLSFPTDFFDMAEVKATPVLEGGSWFYNVGSPEKIDPGQILLTALLSNTIPGRGRLMDVYLRLREGLEVSEANCQDIVLNEVKIYDDSEPFPRKIRTDFANPGEFCVLPDPCMLGDANQDGVISEDDITFIQRIAVELETITPAEYDPAECAWIAADLNCDQIIDSADAILIQRLLSGLMIDLGNVMNSTGKSVVVAKQINDAEVLIGSVDEAVAGGDPVSVSMTINDATDVSGFDLTISYPGSADGDDALLDLVSVATAPLTSDFDLAVNMGDGVIIISASREDALDSGSGAIAMLNFRVDLNAPIGSDLPVSLVGVELKGELGDSREWYGETEKSSGVIGVTSRQVPLLEGEGEVEGEITIEGEGEDEGEVEGEGETIDTGEGERSSGTSGGICGSPFGSSSSGAGDVLMLTLSACVMFFFRKQHQKV